MDNADMSVSDHLKMIHAVHSALPNNLSADGIAAALLTLLVNHPESLRQLNTAQLVKRLRALIRAIAKELGAAFDGCELLQSILSFNVSSESWTAFDEENKARLVFQCMTLLAEKRSAIERNQHAKSTRKAELSREEVASLKTKLTRARKLLLGWCCADYAPLCSIKESIEMENGKKKQAAEVVGAAPADYSSILDGLNNSKFPPWLDVMRSVLFMEDAGSPRLRQFLAPGVSSVESDPEWQDEALRIGMCCEYGADLDDEMVWIVLKTATKKKGGMPPEIALPLLEHLFDSCNKNRKASICLKDPKILWELYNLVEYVPPKGLFQRKENGGDVQDVKMEDIDSNGGKDSEVRLNGVTNSAEAELDIAR
jgi:hypothetical protein